MDRESNIILLDEFDKANSVFSSTFYQLFDEGKYEDHNYYVKLEKSIIVCTSNYTDEAQNSREIQHFINDTFSMYSIKNFRQEINVGHMTDERRCIQWQSCLT